MIRVDKKDEGKALVITLDNGHSAALEKIVTDYNLKGETEAMSFMLSVLSEADGKSINNGKGVWVPSENLKRFPPNMPRSPIGDDLRASDNLKRIDDLEIFRKEFEGRAFDEKVLKSIKESHLIREELKEITFQALKSKVVWIILAGLGVVLTDLIIRAIPHILSAIEGK